MKKIKSLLIATAVTAVAVVPVFANVTGLVSTSVSTSVSVSKPEDQKGDQNDDQKNPDVSTPVSDLVYMKGDADGNGEVALEDAQLTLQAALKITTLEPKAAKAADVDGNGEVELEDAQMVLLEALKITNNWK